MSKSIKFTHAPGGKIETSSEDTALSYLFTIGAMSLTAKSLIDNSGNPQQKFPTDKEGLERIIKMTEQTLSMLSRSIQMLSTKIRLYHHGPVLKPDYIKFILQGRAPFWR